MKLEFAFLLLLNLLVTACAPWGAPPATVSAGRSGPTGTPAIDDYAGLLAALQAQGIAATEGEVVRDPAFPIPTRTLNLPNTHLQVLEYSSRGEVQAAAKTISPDGFRVGNTMVDWVAEPHFFQSGRMIVLYVGHDPKVLSVLERLMGMQFAGLTRANPTVTPERTEPNLPRPTPSAIETGDPLATLPLAPGTTWVYSRTQYSPVDSTLRIITATNLITLTVLSAETITSSLVAHLKQTASLVRADQGWKDNSSNFESDFWYQIIGQRIYTSATRPTDARPPQIAVKGEEVSPVAYQFPLAVGSSWCPYDPVPSYNPKCMSMGKQTVVKRESLTTAAGRFDDCFEIVQDYNSGGVSEWFCNGIGVVARKYDHAGTRFGFEDRLVFYRQGA